MKDPRTGAIFAKEKGKKKEEERGQVSF